MKLKFRKKVRENQKMFSIDDLVPVNYLGKSYPHDPLVNLRNPKFIVASVIDSMFEGDYLAIKSSIRVHHQALGAKSLSTTTQKIFKRSLEELASKYTYVIQWSGEDNVYIASVYELKSCMTHGKTMKQALKMAQEAAQGWLETCIKHKQPVPRPRSKELPL